MQVRLNMWSLLLSIFLGLSQFLGSSVSGQEFNLSCVNPQNQRGTCINIKQCGPLLEILRTQGERAGDFLRSSVCGYDGLDPRVCCPLQNDNDKQRDIKEVRNTTYGPLLPPDCGFSDSPHGKIVGGVPAELGAWPWITALGYMNRKNPNTPRWLCGGALISRRHVLTAGHCVHRRDDLFMVRVGDLDLNSVSDGANPIDVLIERKSVHPNYNPTSFTNDVAVLRLQQDVPFSRNIHPICLPVTEEIRNKNFIRTYPFIAGWGSVYFNGPSSSRLMELQIPVVTMQQCQQAFQSFRTTVIDERVYCAGYAKGGKDACQGDSGGPMMSPKGKTFYIIGVVSYGFRCAEPGYPGVYSRVTAFLDFITSQLV